jgi:hypothetical protein
MVPASTYGQIDGYTLILAAPPGAKNLLIPPSNGK